MFCAGLCLNLHAGCFRFVRPAAADAQQKGEIPLMQRLPGLFLCLFFRPPLIRDFLTSGCNHFAWCSSRVAEN